MLRFILTALFSLIIIISEAQDNNCIKGNAIVNLEREIVLKLTLSYFEDYSVDKVLNKQEKNGISSFKKIINKKDSLSYPDGVKEFLKDGKNGWSKSGIKVFTEYFKSIQTAKESLLLCKDQMYKPSRVVSSKYLDSTFNALLNESLEKSNDENVKVYDDKNSSEFTETKKESAEESYLSEWVYWVIIGVLLVLVIYFYNLYKILDYDLSEIKSKYRKLKNDHKKDKQSYDNRIKNLEKETSLSNEKVEALKNNISTQNDSKSIDESNKSEEPEKVIEDKKFVPKEIYLPPPYADSKINAEEAKESSFDMALYKIILDKSEKSGELWLYKNKDVLELAFNSPDKYLERACINSNAREKHHKSIDTLKPGKVVLEADIWIIEEKLTIKFI